MAKMVFNIWSFVPTKICPIANEFAKISSKFPRILNNHSNIAQDFLVVAKLAKFRQIWSQWLERNMALRSEEHERKRIDSMHHHQC